MSGYNFALPRNTDSPVPARNFGQILADAFDLFLAWRERAAGRKALAQLDPRMLKDVGLTSADVALESDKPFWSA
jgi:uncharacterized protein YjiS (DUF1127 family)